MPPSGHSDAGEPSASLERELKRRIRGEVRFAEGDRALYATDASNYRQVPIGVVVPADREDAVEAIAACRRFGAPIVSRGGGTSLAGQCCNAAVVIDWSRHVSRVLEIDAPRRVARVEPGAVLDDLRAAARAHGLTFGPDPATHNHCTLGGMIGNDSCGVHSVMAAFEGEGGRTADNVDELEIVTYDGVRMRVGRTSDADAARIAAEGGRRGEIYAALRNLRDRYAAAIRSKFPDIPRRVSGYNLPELLQEKGFHVARALVGSEGTCVTVLEATVRLLPEPAARALVVLGFEDVYAAADRVMEVLEHRPIGLEGMDDRLVRDMTSIGLHRRELELLPDGSGWLLVEFGGASRREAEEKGRRLMDRFRGRGATGMKLYDDPAEERGVWRVREAGLGATANVPGKPLTWEGWEDSAVPPERLGGYLRDLRALLEKHGYRGDFYGHFGQGCLHTRIDFDLESAEGVVKFRAFVTAAADLVVSYGGSLSGEHGDGQSRAELLPRMFGPELIQAFREFKRIWDPEGKMNPGKVVDPYPLDSNLRLGPSYRPWHPRTHFRFPEDEGDFARASLRCVGIGECRRATGGVMCPSYMATGEEKHSTRGRARLLFEMLRGDALAPDWTSEAVKEALDLCLSCKGCKGECPVRVDMATYKAEFLSHYYRRRLRPRSAYAFGWIRAWARAASRAPRLVNFLTHAPVASRVARSLAGMAPRREIPRFAAKTFRSWFASRAPARREGPRVLLWPDTFTDHFFPEVGAAAVEVLEAAGCRVSLPQTPLCCGRPLYDYGMLGLAKRLLRKTLRRLRSELDAGVPIVVLEPSCASVFRDELEGLFPADPDARRLESRTFLLAEFLQSRGASYRPPALSGKAMLQLHCHQGAILDHGEEEKALLSRTGLDVEVLDSGCCGMAGSFGFEAGDHYDVSIRCGERVLLPRVREAAPGTLVVADGFSCREQIVQQTGRRALHIAEILRPPAPAQGA